MQSEKTSKKKTISILGCGWYGLELAKTLVNNGYLVKGSVTTPDKLALLCDFNIQPFIVNIQKNNTNYDQAFFQSDILFISIPPKRNTDEQLDFYDKFEQIINAAKLNNVKHLIFISSTAVYGDHNTEVTESDEPNPETASGKLMLKVEQLLKNQIDFTTTIIRFAGLVGPKRHPGRFFSGKTDIPNGQAPINLIHLNDCLGISLAIIEKEAFGHIYNACSKDHPAKQEFYIAAAYNAQLPLPQFKDELTNWKLVSSKNISLLNYNFSVNNWITSFNKNDLY